MKHPAPTRIAIAAIAALAVAAPAASAKTPAQHTKAADKALVRLADAVEDGRVADASRALRASRVHASRAARAARRAAARAKGRRSAVRAARSLRHAAKQYDQNLDTYLGLIGSAEGLADSLAAALLPTMNGEEVTLNSFEDLLTLLPADMREGFSALIAQLSGDHAGEIADLADLIAGDLADDVDAALAEAMVTATTLIQTGIARMEELLGLLGEEQELSVEAVLGAVVGQLGDVNAILGQVIELVDGTIAIVHDLVFSQLEQVHALIGSLLGVVEGVTGGMLPGIDGLFGDEGLFGLGGLFGEDGLLGGGLPGFGSLLGGDFGGLLGGGEGGLLDGLFGDGGLFGGLLGGILPRAAVPDSIR